MRTKAKKYGVRAFSETPFFENISLKKVSDHEWEMRFSFHRLGTFDELKRKVGSPFGRHHI